MVEETLSKALETARGIVADLVKQRPKYKKASALSKGDLNALKVLLVDFNEWKNGGCLRTHRDVCPADIIPLLRTFADRVSSTCRAGDEDEHVKRAVVSLFESILSLPRYQSKFKVKNEVKFYLSYQESDDVKTFVSGTTAHVLMPRDKDFVVATVESKQSTENLAQPKYEAQFLAEVSAELKRISSISLFKPREMCGAITNGVSWAFARRFVWRGEYYLHYAHVVFPAISDCTQQEVDDFFDSVASFLIHMMEVSVNIADGVSNQYRYAAAAAVRSSEEVDGVLGGESDDDNVPDGGKSISGQVPKSMKRPYDFCDDDSHFIASLTAENLKKYGIRE